MVLCLLPLLYVTGIVSLGFPLQAMRNLLCIGWPGLR
jgi:hypothetical protein